MFVLVVCDIFIFFFKRKINKQTIKIYINNTNRLYRWFRWWLMMTLFEFCLWNANTHTQKICPLCVITCRYYMIDRFFFLLQCSCPHLIIIVHSPWKLLICLNKFFIIILIINLKFIFFSLNSNYKQKKMIELNQKKVSMIV